MRYLYGEPAATPGMKPAQMPDSPARTSGWLSASQPLKSPTTPTALAAGAQTANRVPSVPSRVAVCAPSFSYNL